MSNRMLLSGKLGKDPEVFSPQNSDSTLLTLSVANNDNVEKQGDQYVERTVWVKVKFWTKKPQEWIKRLVKGAEIQTECMLSNTEAWKSGDDVKSCAVFDVCRGTFPKVIKPWNDVPASSKTPDSWSPEEDDIPF